MIPAAWPFVLSFLGLAALLVAFQSWWWAAIPLLAAAGAAFFFRDPERIPPAGEDLLVSPADGRVVEASAAAEGGRIGIFLSLLDVHVNRSPVGGTVESVRYKPGSFRPAYERLASESNERNTLDLRSPWGRLEVSQIAGLIARRITCYKRAGDVVFRGERIGHIAFGSRTELILPPGAEITVRPGDHVRGGETVVARLGPEGGPQP